jgi:3-phenylpropionate/trans-cinnamate dioxygenase ferredoxin reductase subunit
VAVARGILVDAQLRTNIANIYAAGDVAEFPSPVSGACVRQETWSNAESQARVVAQNLAGGQVAFEAKSWFWSDQYDYQLQVCGEPSAAVTSVERALEDGDLILFYLDAGGRVVGASGWGLTARIAKEMKLARALVEREVHTSALALADPLTRLKSLL